MSTQVRDFKSLEGIGVQGTCVVDNKAYKVVVGNDFLLEEDYKDEDSLLAFKAMHKVSGEAERGGWWEQKRVDFGQGSGAQKVPALCV